MDQTAAAPDMAPASRPSHDDAYACYAGDACRSLQTVRAEDEARALLVRAHTDDLLVRNLAKRLKRMEALSEQSENLSVAESATRYLLGVSGLVPLQRSQLQVQPVPMTRDPKALATMTDEELDAQLRQDLHAG